MVKVGRFHFAGVFYWAKRADTNGHCAVLIVKLMRSLLAAISQRKETIMADEEIKDGEDLFEKVLSGEKPENPPDESEEEEETPQETEEESGEVQEKEESEEKTGEEEKPKEEEPPKKSYEDLEKENKGYYKEFQKQRERAQKAEVEINTIKELLSKKLVEKEEQPEQTPQEAAMEKFGIEFDEEGEPIIDIAKLKDALGVGDISKVTELEQQTKGIHQTLEEHGRIDKFNREYTSFLQSNEAYPQAMQKFQEAFQFVDSELGKIALEEGVTHKNELEQNPQLAYDILMRVANDPQVQKVMQEKYGGIGIDRIIETDTALRRGELNTFKLSQTLNKLKQAAPAATPETTEEKKEQLKDLTNKASNLAGLRGQPKDEVEKESAKKLLESELFARLLDATPKEAKEILKELDQLTS